MAEAAGAVEARHAVELELFLEPEDARALVEGRRVQGAGRAEDGDLGQVEGGGDVHQAGVVARQAARCGDQRDRVEQRRAAGEDPAGIAGLRRDLGAQLGFAGRAEERDRRAVGIVERARERRVVRRRPALGRAVFGARREGPVAPSLQAVPRRRVVEHGRLEAKTRSPLVVEGGAGERAVERDHRRASGGRGQSPAEQRRSAFGRVADARRNAREPRHERRLERVRQHVGDVEAVAPLRGDAASRRPVEAAMRERQLDDLGHLRHRAEDRRDPGQRRHRQPVAALGQRREQRLGHHRIADPLRRDDERSVHGPLAPGSINGRGPSRPA